MVSEFVSLIVKTVERLAKSMGIMWPFLVEDVVTQRTLDALSRHGRGKKQRILIKAGLFNYETV